MLDGDILEKIYKEIQKKHKINLRQIQEHPENEYYKPYVQAEHFFHATKQEVDEAYEEYKKGSQVYLEDELGDILWDYMNLLYFLELEGNISTKHVLKRCLKKYSERTTGLEKGIHWNEIKQQQKQELLDEHTTKYNS